MCKSDTSGLSKSAVKQGQQGYHCIAAVPLCGLPLLVDNPEGNVLVGWPRTEHQDARVLAASGVGLNPDGTHMGGVKGEMGGSVCDRELNVHIHTQLCPLLSLLLLLCLDHGLHALSAQLGSSLACSECILADTVKSSSMEGYVAARRGHEVHVPYPSRGHMRKHAAS